VASELCEQLADVGHRVTVIAARGGGAVAVDHPGVDVRRVLHRYGFPETVADPFAVRRAARGLVPVDVAVAHSCTNALGLAWAGFGDRLMYVFHASAWREARLRASEHGSPHMHGLSVATAHLLRAQERAAVERARTVVALSSYSASLLARDHPGLPPAHVAPAGIDPGWFAAAERRTLRSVRSIGENEVLALVVRRLEAGLGWPVVLQALALAASRHPLRVAVIGEGPLEGELRALAGQAGLGERVSFLGRLDDGELTDWYHSADIAVLTPTPHEGFGLATLEALAAGCPVVAARTGATPELLDSLEPRLVADRPTPEDIAAALDAGIALGQDSAFRVRCSDHARQWSWEKRLPEWLSLLEETSAGLQTAENEARGARAARPAGRASVFGVPLDALTTDETLELAERAIENRDRVVHTSLNAAKVVRIQHDEALRGAVSRSTVVTADGQAIVWAARLLGTDVPERVTGIDLMLQLIRLADERSLRVFLLGARPEVLDGVYREIALSYPGVVVCGARDGYFAETDEGAVVDAVREARPDILFLALPTPDKELFLDRHAARLAVPFAIGVGGAFDVLAGATRRAPRWMQRIGLEWLFRLIQEPRRLGVRYLVGNTRFLLLTARELARRTPHRSPSGDS
jgi:N-acetylglucosaminyldiphosphoundecaprenol N-acetyl-beta-D-mannosaminyltransferase